MDKKILIIGASGKVAEVTYNLLLQETDYEFVLLTQNENLNITNDRTIIYLIDYSNLKKIKEIIRHEKPNIVINTAAMTNVDACEDKKDECWHINVDLVESIANACKVGKIHLITFSTDYIFDGEKGEYSEEDVPNPKSYYGKSKLAAENIVKSTLKYFTIIRTNVVYSNSAYGKSDFINWIIDSLSNGKTINIIDGQYCNPTYAGDIARGALKIIIKNLFGVYSIAGRDYLNRFEIAEKVAEVFNFDLNLINKISPKNLKQKANRPKRGGLLILKAEAEFGINFANLESGLRTLKYLKDNR